MGTWDWDETMTAWLVFFFPSALVRAAPTSISENTCAPLAVQSNFNYSEYLRSSWYVQKQQTNGYQPELHVSRLQAWLRSTSVWACPGCFGPSQDHCSALQAAKYSLWQLLGGRRRPHSR